MDDRVQFDFPTDSPKIIKVIGVGGGGGNAVNHMYREGIHEVAFVVCSSYSWDTRVSVPETAPARPRKPPKRASKK